MQKRKIITTIVLCLLGIMALLFGIFGKAACADPFSLTDAGIGQTVTLEMTEPLPGDENSFLLYYQSKERHIVLRAAVPDTLVREIERYSLSSGVPVTGILRESSDALDEASYQTIITFYESVAAYTEEFELTEELRNECREWIVPYYLEVTSVNAGVFPILKKMAFIAGCVLLLASVIVLLSFLTRKPIWKIVLTFLIVLGVPALLLIILLFPKIRTLCSIKAEADGVYYMEYTENYKLDEMLNANITSDKELIEWFRKAEFYGIPIEIHTSDIGCSAFKAETPEGDILFGRNFDYPETDTLMVYSAPKNGYASYAMADLNEIGISTRPGWYDPDSLVGRCLMLGAPYVVCDGINEAGLGVSTLQLDIGELHQDTGKPDLYVYTAIRLLLERCGSVDEAVELLKQYDVHSHNDTRQHLFLVDATGRSVVVEWIGEEMYVNELDACTNSVLTPGEQYGEDADWRLPAILAGLSEHDGILTKDETKELLASVSQTHYTEWSCVYDLNHFSVDVYTDEHFDHAYHYGT